MTLFRLPGIPGGHFVRPSLRSLQLFVLTLVLITAWWRLEVVTLRPHAFLSGKLLLSAVVFLAAYNLRKKLTFLPLGSSAT